MENSRTKLSMSIASFRKLRENDLLYVDKTRFIKTLEDLGIRHALLTRPRRFGKSLFLSTLETYYDRNEAENFDRYFAGTFIGAHPTATQGQYAVLFFDLSGIDRADFNHAFCRNLISSFTHFYHRYKIEALRPLLSRGVTDSTSLMQGFFRIVSEHLPLKLMVLIDEYDHTANDLLEHGPEAFPAVAKREALLAGFYAEIENAVTSGVIARSFITGVTRLSKYPVATGFPSAADITEHESFADLYGFAAEELRDVIRTTRSDKKLPMSADEIETRMTDAYCGYRVSVFAFVRPHRAEPGSLHLLPESRRLQRTGSVSHQASKHSYGRHPDGHDVSVGRHSFRQTTGDIRSSGRTASCARCDGPHGKRKPEPPHKRRAVGLIPMHGLSYVQYDHIRTRCPQQIHGVRFCELLFEADSGIFHLLHGESSCPRNCESPDKRRHPTAF